MSSPTRAEIESETAPLLPSITAEDAIGADYGISAQHSRGYGSVPTGNGTNGVLRNPDLSSVENDAAADPTQPDIPKPRLSLILPPIAIGIFLAAMDNTIVVASYGSIGNDLRSLNRTSWIATAYLLTTTSFQPLYGKLSDIFGRKAALLFAYTIFGVGCLLCGLATSIEELIAARAFTGIGGGGMTTVASILVSDIVPLRRRGTWQGILNIVFATGSATGAPLGGLLADTIGWRWSFLFQVPISLLAIITVSIALHLPAHTGASHSSSFRSQLKRVDFLGAFALIPAVFTLLLGLDLGSNSSYTAPLPASLLTSCLLFFLVFTLIETKISSEPFAPSHVVSEPSILAACIVNFLSFAAQMAMLFYLPLYFQAVQSLSASRAGLRLLPLIAGGVLGSLSGGILMQRTGKYYTLTVGAYLLQFFGAVGLFLATGYAFNSTTITLSSVTLMAFGNGIGVTSTLIAIIATAGPADQAVATAASYLFRALGMVAGIGAASGLMQTSLRRILYAQLGRGEEAEKIIQGVRESLSYLEKLEPEVRRVVEKAYEQAARGVWGMSVIGAAGAIVASLFIKERGLEGGTIAERAREREE